MACKYRTLSLKMSCGRRKKRLKNLYNPSFCLCHLNNITCLHSNNDVHDSDEYMSNNDFSEIMSIEKVIASNQLSVQETPVNKYQYAEIISQYLY